MQTNELNGPGTANGRIEPAQYTAARVVGFLYVAQMVLAIFGDSFVRGRMIVRGDAAQTAANIVGAERLFRFSLATDLIIYATVIVLVWGLYVILKPVRRDVALLAVFLRLVENAILASTILGAFGALAFLSGAEYLRAFDQKQLEAFVSVSLRVYGAGFSIGFVFLGFGSAVFSYLWWKSRYIPSFIAVWGIFSSLLLSLVTLVIIVIPGLGASLGLTYMMPMGLYEVGLGLWLLIRGLKEPSASSPRLTSR
ncbi:MAG: DUF4386 domain-containing protein [Spartobacteria bacterium]